MAQIATAGDKKDLTGHDRPFSQGFREKVCPKSWILIELMSEGNPMSETSSGNLPPSPLAAADESSLRTTAMIGYVLLLVAGVNGLTALVAYPATAPIASLLQRLGEPSTNPPPPAAPEVAQLAGLAAART